MMGSVRVKLDKILPPKSNLVEVVLLLPVVG